MGEAVSLRRVVLLQPTEGWTTQRPPVPAAGLALVPPGSKLSAVLAAREYG